MGRRQETVERAVASLRGHQWQSPVAVKIHAVAVIAVTLLTWWVVHWFTAGAGAGQLGFGYTAVIALGLAPVIAPVLALVVICDGLPASAAALASIEPLRAADSELDRAVSSWQAAGRVSNRDIRAISRLAQGRSCRCWPNCPNTSS
ncbi:MAG: hypothetical protein A2580_18040 [Hydrogenophilales bacterium RIFOXYD1_FULL_62_11]|nr:MAG: hypothetical protein A2580_18040 [Hydrogenophilales bacterium RIFOXYD1_FULL_62_11]